MTDPLQEINRFMGNIDGRLEAIQEQLDRHITRHEGIHTSLEKDVDLIKADVNKAKGASLVVGVFAGMVGAIGTLITKHFWGD